MTLSSCTNPFCPAVSHAEKLSGGGEGKALEPPTVWARLSQSAAQSLGAPTTSVAVLTLEITVLKC